MTTQSIVQQVLADNRLWCETFIIIEDRHRALMRFSYNPAQELLHAKLTGRDLVVKAGQLGITTFFMSRYFKDTVTQPGTTAAIVAHEEFLTQRLLHRTQFWYDQLPVGGRPEMSHKSVYEKFFPKLNSVFYIGTARSYVFGRGEPIHRFLGSEVSFWPDPSKILVPTMQRVPLDGEMVLESTPNGESSGRSKNEGDTFYDMVQDTIEGLSVWNLIELPWWLEPEYRLPLGSNKANPTDIGVLTLSDEELKLIRRAKWDDSEAEERIRWRRRKIREIKHFFHQEFMEDLVSCFLVAGDMFYDADTLEHLRKGCYDSPYSYYGAKVWFRPVGQDDQEPITTNPIYMVTVDPGQGKATLSVAQAWRLDLEEGVRHEATLSGHYDPIAFAPLVIRLAKYYHNAMIVPEANGHGMAFCAEVKNYPNLYRRRDVVSGKVSMQIGWLTTGASKVGASGTKPFMMASLQNLLPNIKTHDLDFIREMMNVRYSGENILFQSSDDHHDAGAIMAATRHVLTGYQDKGYVGRAGFNW